MRTIIAGTRTITDQGIVDAAIADSGITISRVVCGMARGVDSCGKTWADGKGIPVDKFPADWDKFGKAAGYRRNVQMAENADALILVWDGNSRGSMHMQNIAQSKGLLIFERIVQ